MCGVCSARGPFVYMAMRVVERIVERAVERGGAAPASSSLSLLPRGKRLAYEISSYCRVVTLKLLNTASMKPPRSTYYGVHIMISHVVLDKFTADKLPLSEIKSLSASYIDNRAR